MAVKQVRIAPARWRYGHRRVNRTRGKRASACRAQAVAHSALRSISDNARCANIAGNSAWHRIRLARQLVNRWAVRGGSGKTAALRMRAILRFIM